MCARLYNNNISSLLFIIYFFYFVVVVPVLVCFLFVVSLNLWSITVVLQ